VPASPVSTTKENTLANAPALRHPQFRPLVVALFGVVGIASASSALAFRLDIQGTNVMSGPKRMQMKQLPAAQIASPSDPGTLLVEDRAAMSPGNALDLTAHEYASPNGATDNVGGEATGRNAPPPAEPKPLASTAGWWSYRIDVGDHAANIVRGSVGSRPRHGLAWNGSRTYQFAFDPSAEYAMTTAWMKDPADQADWNKLPGFSDCGNVSLAKNGAMFGWRWNVEKQVLEVTAYWNNDGRHLTTPEPLFTLTREELASGAPLLYKVVAERNQYTFSVTGTVAGRAINASATGTRACPGRNRLKWNSGMYFGGTSTAPQTITGRINEF
jgi:hypothetical protein